jgi:hypothetical protein
VTALVLALVVAQYTGTPATTKAAPATCGTPRQSVVAVGGVAAGVPASPLSARAWADVCVSVENSGSPIVKCRADGVAPELGTAAAGDALAKGDCIRYAPPAGQAIRCIASAEGTAVTITECTRTP